MRKLIDRNDFKVKQLKPLLTRLDHRFGLLDADRIQNGKEAWFVSYFA